MTLKPLHRKKLKFSIVTPSYNQAEFIERTILSVISQAGEFDIEYIVMDGGSSDKTVEILKKYEEDISNGTFKKQCKNLTFLWKSEKDTGQSNAINKGLKLATGDIITYLNSDDTHTPGAYEIIAKELGSSKHEWCTGKCHIIDRYDHEIRKWITFYKNFHLARYSYSKLLSENFIPQMSVFWKRSLMEKVGLFNESEHLCMDYDYWLRLGSHSSPLFINEYLSNFRFYHTSKSGAQFSRQFSEELAIAKKHAKGKYKFSLFLHACNYYKIVFIYRILGFLKM